MSTAKTIFKFLFKWTAVLIVLAALVVGFSFLERGYLAREISLSLNLPAQQWWQNEPIERVVPQSPEVTDDWIFIGNQNQILPELKEPAKRVKMREGQVIGILEAREVRLYENAQAGSVVAVELAGIYGGAVRQNVQGARVVLAPDERAEYDYRNTDPDIETDRNRGIVYGNISGSQILTLAGTSVLGNAGTPESQLDLAGTVQGNATGRQIILRSSALIRGDLITSSESVVMEPGASVLGRIVNSENKPIKIVKGETRDEYIYREQSDRAGYNQPAERIFVHDDNNFGLVFLWIPILLGIIATLFLTYSFFTRDVTDGVDNLTFSPLRALWTGFVTVAIGIPLMFLLFISILGIPVALVLVFTLGLAGLVGISGICLMVGRKVCAAFDLSGISQAKQMLLGILLVAHLVWVPVFGWLVLAIGGVMGLGSIAMIWWPRFKSRWHNWRQSGRQKNAEPEQLEKSQCEEKELEKEEDENENEIK
ncbi:MAG: hypothetical protein VR69_07295 [Peptococcaceae bacterium BRH_c4b]|nr:MAG: hypothetical protein VR69_07295 [Peptococcaceae bacterium BRH_c4b]